MTEDFKLDWLDLRILAQLQQNGRMTHVDLADGVGLSPSESICLAGQVPGAFRRGGTAQGAPLLDNGSQMPSGSPLMSRP